MKNVWKKVMATVLAAAMVFSLAACGSGSGSSGGSGGEAGESGGKACTIGVALYSDGNAQTDAIKAYLDEISGSLNTTFKYTLLTQTDEAANLTKIQELISSGVDGIICTMDLGSEAIIEECEAAGVYLGGFLCDYETSYTSSYEKIFQNEYFVGTVADGDCGDDVTSGQDYFDSLIEYNERNADNPITHVSMVMFPVWAFPLNAVKTEQFTDAVEEYNKTAEEPITIDPLNEETDVLQFTQMDTTYFSKHSGIQGIISFAAGYNTYSTMVTAGVDDEIKLFASGYDRGSEEYFGTKGAGTLQQIIVSAPEAINYPLVLLLNAINGVEFSDQPEDAERYAARNVILNSDEDMEIFKDSIWLTADGADAMFTGEEVLNMTAYANPEATYADLVESLQHMTIDDMKK